MHGFASYARRGRSGYKCRTRCGQHLGNGFRPVVDRLRENLDFRKLLLGERQPTFQLDIQLGFQVEIVRHVQERARGSNDQPFAAAYLGDCLQRPQGLVQIRAPDIPAIDNSERQPLVFRQLGQDCIQLVATSREIDVQARHRQGNGQFQSVAQIAEVGGQHQRQFRQGSGKVSIRFPKRFGGSIREVGHEDRLVDLDRGRSGGGQPP